MISIFFNMRGTMLMWWKRA